MKFITLTRSGIQQKIMINPIMISEIEQYELGTVVTLMNGRSHDVIEQATEILNLIKKSEYQTLLTQKEEPISWDTGTK